MSLRFLLDENQRGQLWRYIRRHNAGSASPLDAVRAGDSPDLPLGADDEGILAWAERENRILVSVDRATLAGHLGSHIAAGHMSPGVFLLCSVPLREVVDFLILAARASEAREWENQIIFIP
jgi:hypothetical protein